MFSKLKKWWCAAKDKGSITDPAIEIDEILNNYVFPVLDEQFNEWVKFGWSFDDECVKFYATDMLNFEQADPVEWLAHEDDLYWIYDHEGLDALVETIVVMIVYQIGKCRFLCDRVAEEVECELGSKETN